MSAKLFKKVNSSDYISYKKRSTIVGEYANALNTNPVKTNGKQYNQNFMFVSTQPASDISNCLLYSQNYELKQNYTSGENNIQEICKDIV
jgi:hypothetical protein